MQEYALTAEILLNTGSEKDKSRLAKLEKILGIERCTESSGLLPSCDPGAYPGTPASFSSLVGGSMQNLNVAKWTTRY